MQQQPPPPYSTRTLRTYISCAATASLLAWLTSLQEPRCAQYITATTLFYAIAYAVLRALGVPDIACKHASEWRSRALSSVNAIVLIGGSLLCFSEWPYENGEGWITTDGDWGYSGVFASLFAGFLHWDLCWILFHSNEYYDPGTMVHHALFIGVTHYVLCNWYLKKPFAWLSFTELSTPFLNARWFLANQKESEAYIKSSFCFAMTFLLTRVFGYTLGLVDVWRSFTHWKAANTGLYMVILALHAGYALNLFWAGKVVTAAKRALLRRKSV